MQLTLELAVWVLCSYIVGSIPFSYAIPKLFKGIDIKEHGSGNAGTTNVYRVLGMRYALPALILDIFKGGIIMYLATFRFNPDEALFISVFSVMGHCYSFMLGFKGGKGVATAGGIIIVRSPTLAAVLFSIIVLAVLTTRYVSLGSILVALALPLANYFMTGEIYSSLIFAALAVFVIFRHRANIKRLMAGSESKISFNRKNK